jgi:hypothetical protein
MTHADPVYFLSLAFDERPLVACFGLDGLMDTLPRLEPNLYAVLDRRGRLVGDATIAPDGEWWVELEGGTFKLGRGYTIV